MVTLRSRHRPCLFEPTSRTVTGMGRHQDHRASLSVIGGGTEGPPMHRTVATARPSVPQTGTIGTFRPAPGTERDDATARDPYSP